MIGVEVREQDGRDLPRVVAGLRQASQHAWTHVDDDDRVLVDDEDTGGKTAGIGDRRARTEDRDFHVERAAR